MPEDRPDHEVLTDLDVLDFIAITQKGLLGLIAKNQAIAKVTNDPIRATILTEYLKATTSQSGRRSDQLIEAIRAEVLRGMDEDMFIDAPFEGGGEPPRGREGKKTGKGGLWKGLP